MKCKPHLFAKFKPLGKISKQVENNGLLGKNLLNERGLNLGIWKEGGGCGLHNNKVFPNHLQITFTNEQNFRINIEQSMLL